jgi:alkylation response protein AidB-like acyl-CoA dehydrogenase
MSYYQPQLDDVQFILQRVVQAPERIAQMPAFAEVDADLMTQILDEAGKFIGEQIAPLNRVGDEIGAQWHQGQVTMPPGFKDAYQAFWQAGWASLCTSPDDGGQGLPAVLESVMYEWLSAANHGWTMAPGILHGAYECVKHHASDALKAQYLGKMGTGEWLATMCLTEPHAGSDLGLATTKAVPQADGSYALSGTKIFISSGEHDLTDNIVHLVLARLPDAPPGPKGLSLFLVPKFYADGSRSAVHCERIEEKMGIHGSPTCVMRFDEARAWLVGDVGRGLNAMFVMMNAARLHVALQGVGLLDAAWQKANAYAHERRQMRAPRPAGEKGTTAADLIIEHPAVRRILDTQRAWIDGGRVLAYETGLALDLAKHHPDAAQRDAAQRWCALITPILKAAWTEQGFHGASDCLQVFGGHGYVSEWGIEQNVRDARIAMIYEGTNEIQAIDLLMRKVVSDGGTALHAMLDALGAQLSDTPHEVQVQSLLAQLRDVTQHCVATSQRADGAVRLSWIAGDYLRLASLALLAWAWTRIERAPGADQPRWQAPARALRAWVLPEFDMRARIVHEQLAPTHAAA